MTSQRLAFLICVIPCYLATVYSTEFPSTEQAIPKSLSGKSTDIVGDEEFDILGDVGKPERQIPFEADFDIFVRNVDFNQPLLQAMDNAMSESEFSALQDCLRDHPMRHHNVNSDVTFAGTTGFLLSFNEKGIDRLKNHTSFNCLVPYFERYRLSNTNGWVLNMVWAETKGYNQEFAIKRHVDNAIINNYRGEIHIMPVQTNVLYVFVPEDMRGGTLEAFDYDASEEEMKKGPMGFVQPVENRMAFFRGDAQHQVRSYNTSAKNILRGSLVFEQYNIPKEYRDVIIDFVWKDRNGGEMM